MHNNIIPPDRYAPADFVVGEAGGKKHDGVLENNRSFAE